MIRRRLFNFAAAVSLLLFVATLVMWIRSVGGSEVLQQLTRHLGWDVVFEEGELCVQWSTPADDETFSEVSPLSHRHEPTFFQFYDSPLQGSGYDYRIAEFRFADISDNGVARRICSPCWFLAVIFALIPVYWAWKYRAERRSYLRMHGFCTTCGYNLTGNTSGTCPECGTPVPSKPEEIA